MTDSSEDHLSEEIKKAQELELEEAEAEPLQYTVCDLSSLEEEFNSKKRVLDLACQKLDHPCNRDRPDPNCYVGPAAQFNENLKCWLCKMVACDPVQCDGETECEELFCRQCVYTESGSDCPNCDSKFPEKPVKLNRVLR